MEIKFFIYYFLILIVTIKESTSVCIPGDNCPLNTGVCKADMCECLPGYYTLINGNTNINPVFCNYKQYSKWYPFLLELFFPSIGLFFIRRFFHGVIKLALFLPIIWGSANFPFFWFLIFVIVYITDLILIYFRFYRDGNGVPLA